MANRQTIDPGARSASAPFALTHSLGTTSSAAPQCDIPPRGKPTLSHFEEGGVGASENLGASGRASSVSTTFTDGELRHKFSIESDLGFVDGAVLKSIRLDGGREEVFPTSNPDIKKKKYSLLALQPRSGGEAPSLFSDLLESEVDLIRANISQLEGLLESLNDELEPVCLRDCWKRCREIDMMSAPEDSSLLQRRSAHFGDSWMSL